MTGIGNGKGGAGHRTNVIDQGTTFKGVLTATSTVVVLGVIEGEVSGPAVEVEESGVLRGKAKLTELRSRGELAGEFEADEVELSGRVRDQTVIRTKSLLVGAPGRAGGSDATFGECQIDVGEVPSKEQAIAAALAANRTAPATPPSELTPPAASAPGAEGYLAAAQATPPSEPTPPAEAEEDPTVIISRERATAIIEAPPPGASASLGTTATALGAPIPLGASAALGASAEPAPPSAEGEAAPTGAAGRRGKRPHADRPAEGT